MKTLLVLLALAAAASATEPPTVSFKLPDNCGNPVRVPDIGARYALLVYQGIP